MKNPFLDDSPFNQPITLEQGQRIHFQALRSAIYSIDTTDMPGHLSLSDLHQLAHFHGTEVCLLSPLHIKQVFTGVTTSVLQTIKMLYCDPIGRSMTTVYQIMFALAQATQVQALSYEAIWAVCRHLSRLRDEATIVTPKFAGHWMITVSYPPLQAVDKEGRHFAPAIVCVIDADAGRVIAFQVSKPEDIAAAVRTALYEGIVNSREPEPFGPSGLSWYFPSRLSVHSSIYSHLYQPCTHLSIPLYEQDETAPTAGRERVVIDTLESDWSRNLVHRSLSLSQIATLFDTYLTRTFGHGPRRGQAEKVERNKHLVGYSSDPASVFPTLHILLPEHRGVINEKAVIHNGFHYEHDLLAYWPDTPVTLRRSLEAEARIWVYMEGNILCEAMARELRRRDGTYRPNRGA